METVLICTVFGVFLCFAFVFGIKIGELLSQGKTIDIPSLNPIKQLKKNIENKSQRKERENYNKLLQNIDNYDGTELGQKEVTFK